MQSLLIFIAEFQTAQKRFLKNFELSDDCRFSRERNDDAQGRMRYCQKLCIGDGRILVKIVWLGGLLGLFFAIDESDAGNYLWNQFEALEPTPMLLGFQAEFKDHGQCCDS